MLWIASFKDSSFRESVIGVHRETQLKIASVKVSQSPQKFSTDSEVCGFPLFPVLKKMLMFCMAGSNLPSNAFSFAW